MVFSVLTNFYSSFKTRSHVTCSEALSDSLPKENSCLPPLLSQSPLLRALSSLLAGHCVLSFYGSLPNESGSPSKAAVLPHSHASPPSPDGQWCPSPICVAPLPQRWELCPACVPVGHSAQCRTVGTPEPALLLTNVHSLSPPRADEIEMIMTDLERANQVGCLMASGIKSQ